MQGAERLSRVRRPAGELASAWRLLLPFKTEARPCSSQQGERRVQKAAETRETDKDRPARGCQTAMSLAWQRPLGTHRLCLDARESHWPCTRTSPPLSTSATTPGNLRTARNSWSTVKEATKEAITQFKGTLTNLLKILASKVIFLAMSAQSTSPPRKVHF